MKRDPNQLDLLDWLNANGERIAQRVPIERRSKQSVYRTASVEDDRRSDSEALVGTIKGGMIQTIPFPLNRRIKKIRTVTQTLVARKSEQGRGNYWHRIVTELSSQLVRHGASDEEVAHQIELFEKAVILELNQYPQKDQKPNGAA